MYFVLWNSYHETLHQRPLVWSPSFALIFIIEHSGCLNAYDGWEDFYLEGRTQNCTVLTGGYYCKKTQELLLSQCCNTVLFCIVSLLVHLYILALLNLWWLCFLFGVVFAGNTCLYWKTSRPDTSMSPGQPLKTCNSSQDALLVQFPYMLFE